MFLVQLISNEEFSVLVSCFVWSVAKAQIFVDVFYDVLLIDVTCFAGYFGCWPLVVKGSVVFINKLSGLCHMYLRKKEAMFWFVG